MNTQKKSQTSELSRLSLPDGYAISVGGETEQMTESFVQLGFALVLGIFLIYMVMAVQFESFMYPFNLLRRKKHIKNDRKHSTLFQYSLILRKTYLKNS